MNIHALHQLPVDQYDDLLRQKTEDFQRLFESFETPDLEVFPSPVEHFRMRAEFRIWHDEDDCCYAMFEPGQKASSKTLIRIEQFPTACTAINALMQPLLTTLKTQDLTKQRLFQIEFLATLSGDMLVTLIYHKKLDEEWAAVARQLEQQFGIYIIGRSRKQKLVLSQDYVVETLNVNGRDFHYKQIEGGFTQPNAVVCESMVSWAVDCAENSTGDLLELYCGNGNFTLPLSLQFNKTLATEISKTSVQAAQWNIAKNNIENLHIIRLSSEEFTEAYTGQREFERLKRQGIALADYAISTVFVDPPRAGIDDDTLRLIQQFERIIYISCNPLTLQANLKMLSTSHSIERIALFDQFPYTHHVESGVLLSRK